MTSSKIIRFTLPGVLFLALPEVTISAQTDDTAEAARRQSAARHYAARVRDFKDENKDLTRFVFVGDSLTEGFDLGFYFPHRDMLNRGIGSDTIGYPLTKGNKRGILSRLDPSVLETGASHVFLLIGINDILEGTSPADMKTGYEKILSSIRGRAPHMKIYVQSLLPVTGNYSAYNSTILQLNTVLRDLADRYACTFVDLHSSFTDPAGQLQADLTVDGVHLSDAGYRTWSERVRTELGW